MIPPADRPQPQSAGADAGADDGLPLSPGGPTTAAQWRENLLIQLRVVYYPLLLGAAGAIILGAQTVTLRWYGVFLVFMTLIATGVLHVKRLSYVWRAAALIMSFVVIALSSFILVGNTPGSVLSAAFALVLSALLLGPRQTVWLLLCLMMSTLGLTLLVHLELWSGPSPLEVNPSSSAIWFRMSLVTAALWAGICFPVLYVVSSVERGLLHSEDNLRQLRQEQEQRMQAVAAHQEAEQRAFQSQKLESLGRLASGVAHDFNNALVVIRGWNSIRQESDDPDDHRQAFDAIEEATNQATHLASQLLTFGRQEVRQPRHLALDRVISSTADTLRRLLPAGIELTLDLQSAGVVFADESQLQQVLINLVNNARDALPSGGKIEIRTSVAKSPPPDAPASAEGWLLLEVRDNGVGMPPDIQRLAFEPFFTSKAAGEGSGLGLSSVLGIVRQSEGHIELSSDPGEGTRFSIFLPATSGQPGAAPETPAPQSSDAQAGRRVLVVEDDTLARKLLVRTLESAGLEVVAVEDGSEAIARLDDQTPPFDLLCSDAVFPGDSLVDVIAAFRRHSARANVLICSGYMPEGLDAQGLEEGDYAFMAKPFKPQELVVRVRALLSD